MRIVMKQEEQIKHTLYIYMYIYVYVHVYNTIKYIILRAMRYWNIFYFTAIWKMVRNIGLESEQQNR